MIENNYQERPYIGTITNTDQTKAAERFQNETLRPIIKMQHDLMVSFFLAYIVSKKCVFQILSSQQKKSFIESAFGKDLSFRNKVKGMVIGHFDPEEFKLYIEIQKEVDKRIINIVQKRIMDESI